MEHKGKLILKHKMWNVIVYTMVFEFWCFLVLLLAIGFLRRGLKYNDTFNLISGIVGIIILTIIMIIVPIFARLSKFNIYENGLVVDIPFKEYIKNRDKYSKPEKFFHFRDILNIDTKHDWIIIETREEHHLIGFLSKKTKNRVLSIILDTQKKFESKTIN